MTFENLAVYATATKLVEKQVAVKAGEKVLVISGDTDPEHLLIAEALTKVSRAVGAETVMCIMATPRKMHGNKPPDMVIEALKVADVAFVPTTISFSHHKAVTDARQSSKLRYIPMKGITLDNFIHGAAEADYDEIQRKTKILAELMTGASQIRMTTDSGSDLTLSVKGRKGKCIAGFATEPGESTGFPQGECAIAPVEGTAEGTVVVDPSTDFCGRLSQPITLTIKRGKVVDIKGGAEARQLREIIDSGGHDANNIGEFAIGTNPMSRLLGNSREEKIKEGWVHIAVGSNTGLGGTCTAQIHLDCTVRDPSVWLDDREVVRKGVLLPL